MSFLERDNKFTYVRQEWSSMESRAGRNMRPFTSRALDMILMFLPPSLSMFLERF
jgi:hypothetical protein